MVVWILAAIKSITFISTGVFVILNIIENAIHYSNGINSKKKKVFSFAKLSKRDWLKIVGVMIIFAILQGFFTTLIYHIVNRK